MEIPTQDEQAKRLRGWLRATKPGKAHLKSAPSADAKTQGAACWRHGVTVSRFRLPSQGGVRIQLPDSQGPAEGTPPEGSSDRGSFGPGKWIRWLPPPRGGESAHALCLFLLHTLKPHMPTICCYMKACVRFSCRPHCLHQEYQLTLTKMGPQYFMGMAFQVILKAQEDHRLLISSVHMLQPSCILTI